MMQKENKNKLSKKRNKDMVMVAYMFFGMFLILAGYFIYVAGIMGPKHVNNPYNKLVGLLAESVVRGSIYSADGEVLASTGTDENGQEYRTYPYGEEYCHTVGSIEEGVYGLEAACQYDLLSSADPVWKKFLHDMSGKKDTGNSIVTTLDTKVTRAAYEAMEGYQGSAIVMDSRTGEILAMVSRPGYDPNKVSKTWEDITTREDSPLLNRATQGLYTPGSIFKIITLYEYLQEHKEDAASYSYECLGGIDVDGTGIHCSNGTSHGTVDLEDSFAYSCNCSFVNLGLMLDLTRFQKTAKQLLFNSKLPMILDYKKSEFSLKDTDSDFVKAQTFFGQGETLITPLHAAILVQAIANDGMAMKPKLVSKIVDGQGNTVKENKNGEYQRLFDKTSAQELKEYMKSVVDYGTAKRLQGFTNLTVYGKTGTAQTGNKGIAHSWFVGFAENAATNQSYTVVVVTESVDETVAAPSVSVTKEILKVLD